MGSPFSLSTVAVNAYVSSERRQLLFIFSCLYVSYESGHARNERVGRLEYNVPVRQKRKRIEKEKK